MRCDGFHVHHRQHVLVQGQHLDLLHLVRGAEAIEEMHEGHPGFERGRLRNKGEVHRLLHRGWSQHRKAGRTRGHNVAVIAKNRQGVRSHVRAEMWNTVGNSSPAILNMLGIFNSNPCDAVNVLARHRSAAPHGPRRPPQPRSAFPPPWARTPQIAFAFGSPLITPLAHRRGGRDGVDRHDLVALERHVGHRLVAVHCRCYPLAHSAQKLCSGVGTTITGCPWTVKPHQPTTAPCARPQHSQAGWQASLHAHHRLRNGLGGASPFLLKSQHELPFATLTGQGRSPWRRQPSRCQARPKAQARRVLSLRLRYRAVSRRSSNRGVAVVLTPQSAVQAVS
jgi:hypothetical protein